MVPILLKNESTIGFLHECLTCTVTEKKNGIYELLLTYPISGNLFSEIKTDVLIKAKPNDTAKLQLFRIYSISKPISGKITVKAEHISYELSHFPVFNVATTGTATQAIDAVLVNAQNNTTKKHRFTVSTTDMTAIKDFSYQVGSARSALGGTEGSILDTYGGEFEFDNYVVKLHKNRGSDTGVIIAYGKNLKSVNVTESLENSYTHIFPYALKDEVLTTITSGKIAVANNSGIDERVLIKDFSSFFSNDEEITPETLLSKTNEWLKLNDINSPEINMSVSFVHLWQSPEYAHLSALEKVSLCDYVTVWHKELGVNIKAQVTKTIYNVLSEQYEKIEIGSAKPNFADTINQTTRKLNEAMKLIKKSDTSAITKAYLEAIDKATKAITGASGGHVVLNPSENPQELLVMNSSSIESSTKIWRWNLGGLGYSKNGYNGPYSTAITMDGAINADFITAGTLNANIIKAGILKSVDGGSFFNLETGLLQTNNAIINGGSINIGGLLYRTKIEDGVIYQYSGSALNPVGGLYSVSSGSNFYEALFCNSKIATGVSIGIANLDNNSHTMLAEFTSSATTITKQTHILENGIVTNKMGKNLFAGITHYRTYNFTGTGVEFTASVALGCGVANYSPSAALEVKDYGSNTIRSRLDVYESSGEAMICLRGTKGSYTSKPLELGQSIWFGGDFYSRGYLLESTENVKENISEVGSVVDLFKTSKIYNYNYIDDDSSEESGDNGIEDGDLPDNTAPEGGEVEETEPNSYGFVIERETPSEVISDDGKHIDLYSMCSLIWKATQELISRVEVLESKE